MDDGDNLRQTVLLLLTWVAGVVVSAFQWLLRREVHRHESVASDHEVRLRVMEADRVTRSDINALYTRLNAMAERGEERHIELLDRIGK